MLKVLLTQTKFIIVLIVLSLLIRIPSLNLSHKLWFLDVLNDILCSTFHFLHSWIFFDFLSYNRSPFFCLLDSSADFFFKLIRLKIVHSFARFLLNKMSTLGYFVLNIFPIHYYKNYNYWLRFQYWEFQLENSLKYFWIKFSLF